MTLHKMQVPLKEVFEQFNQAPKRYKIDLTAILPTDPQFHDGEVVEVTETNVSSSGCTLSLAGGDNYSYDASHNQRVLSPNNEAAKSTSARFAQYDLPGFDPAAPQSMNGILNNEHGASQPITTSNP